MKKLIALAMTIICLFTLTACGLGYNFCKVGEDKKSLDIKLDNSRQGYKWISKIGNPDKLEVLSEKNRNGKYIAKFGTITKSGKGKKGGKATVAFTYVNKKDPDDIYLGYVVTTVINAKGKLKIHRVEEYKVNFETTLKEDE